MYAIFMFTSARAHQSRCSVTLQYTNALAIGIQPYFRLCFVQRSAYRSARGHVLSGDRDRERLVAGGQPACGSWMRETRGEQYRSP
jgi:hypothetical protein